MRCDEFDTDLLECASDAAEELENACAHSNDVGIRCYPRTWAGIRFGMTARESQMKGVVIERAGLLDYSGRVFKPGEVSARLSGELAGSWLFRAGAPAAPPRPVIAKTSFFS